MFPMQPVRFPNGWQEGDDYPVVQDETWPKGTPVTFDASEDAIDEFAGTSTVTNLLGIALDGVTSGVGSHNPSGLVCVAKATRSNIFAAKLVNGSGVVQVPDIDNVDVAYGILKVGTGAAAWWGVDEDDTTHVVVNVIGYDAERDIVFFKFIESAIQFI